MTDYRRAYLKYLHIFCDVCLYFMFVIPLVKYFYFTFVANHPLFSIHVFLMVIHYVFCLCYFLNVLVDFVNSCNINIIYKVDTM